MGMVKNDMMVHAEVDCLLNAKEDVSGWTLYTTHTPCHECAKAIAAARIGRVVTLGLGTTSDLGQSRGKLVLNLANIPLEEVQV